MKLHSGSDAGQGGLVGYGDAESGGAILADSSSRAARETVARNARAIDARHDDWMRRSKVDVIDVDMSTSYVDPLRRFFMRRARRAGRRR